VVYSVVEQYSKAFFEMAKKGAEIESTFLIVEEFARLVESSPDLKCLFSSPAFSQEERMQAASAVLDHCGFTGCGAACVKLTVLNQRLGILPMIARSLRLRVMRDRGELEAEVVTAQALETEHLEELRSVLAGVSRGMNLTFSTKVDSGVLGGLIVQIEDLMIDTSLRTKLKALAMALKGGRCQ